MRIVLSCVQHFQVFFTILSDIFLQYSDHNCHPFICSRSKLIKKYPILKPMVDDILKLVYVGHRIIIIMCDILLCCVLSVLSMTVLGWYPVKGLPQRFSGTIASICGDNLGSNALGGFKEGSTASNGCRQSKHDFSHKVGNPL